MSDDAEMRPKRNTGIKRVRSSSPSYYPEESKEKQPRRLQEGDDILMDSNLLAIQKVADAKHDFKTNFDIETVKNTLVETCKNHRYDEIISKGQVEDYTLDLIGIKKDVDNFFRDREIGTRREQYTCITFSVNKNNSEPQDTVINDVKVNNGDKTPEDLRNYLRNINEPKLIIDVTDSNILSKILEFRGRDVPKARFINNIPTTFDPAPKINP